MNVKNTRMRRLQELPFVWSLALLPLGQNPTYCIGCIELPGGSSHRVPVPGSSQSNKACCFLQLESLSLHRASSPAAYSSNLCPTSPTVELLGDAWAF